MAYGLLNGKKGIVFGPMDETSLGWSIASVSYTHLRAHETVLDLVCRLLLENTNKLER